VFIIDKHPIIKIMKWPLLGILAVVCLQLGFGAYNAIERSLEPVFTIRSIVNDTNMVADSFDDSIYTDTFYTAARRTISGRNNVERSTIAAAIETRSDISPLYAAEKGRVALPNFKASKMRRQLVAMERPLESTVITYASYSQPVRAGWEPENDQVTRAAFTQSRSFASKSFSVIKKPYKWLKALGSKLD
jgi:hypothetical protein